MRQLGRGRGGRPWSAGDLNMAHTRADLQNWKANVSKAGFLPDEHAYFDRWLAPVSGWTSRRAAGPGGGPYTWWSWRARPSTTTPGGGSTTSWPPPHWAAGCPGRGSAGPRRTPSAGATTRRSSPTTTWPTAGCAGPACSRHTGPDDGHQAGRLLADRHGRCARARGAAPPRGPADFIPPPGSKGPSAASWC